MHVSVYNFVLMILTSNALQFQIAVTYFKLLPLQMFYVYEVEFGHLLLTVLGGNHSADSWFM